MRHEATGASELFLTFLHWARALSERAHDTVPATGVALGMRARPRHGSCSASGAIESRHEARVHEL
jgi:hypothetical protein